MNSWPKQLTLVFSLIGYFNYKKRKQNKKKIF